jgi:small-conductance mechanosensitive channel/CRP-like cAMP-binding protein
MKRARIYLPLVLSLTLFGLYAIFSVEPLFFDRFGDVRETVFGRDLRYLLFGAFVPLILVLVRILDSFVFDFVLSRRRHMVAPLLLREVVSFALYAVLFASLVSWIFNTSVSGFFATTTVVAAVVGLALQETLGNLFSGISLHMERTFDVGDVLKSGDSIGVVESVNWRATRIRTFNNNVVVMPNSILGRDRLEVFPASNLNARVVTVNGGYEVPPARVISILEKAAANVEGVSHEIPSLARVGSFGDSAVIYEVKYWTRVYHRRDIIDAEVRKAIWYAFKRNEISIPYPIRAYHPYSSTPEETPVGQSDILQRINSVDILAPLSADEHRTLAAATQVHVYSKGETILKQGQAGDSMFVVHDGTVSVRLLGEKGTAELAQLGAGSIFGEMALLTGEARTADVVAISDVTTLEIGKSSLQPILAEDPGLAAALTSKILERRESTQAVSNASEEQITLLGRIRSYFGL